MGTNNFKVFNEGFSNSQTDAQYLADAQRIGGVVPGAAPSALHNKMYRQVSIMSAALGQVIANRGYNASDVDLAALITALNSAFSPFATSANITLYVSPTGSNVTGDGTVGNPYATTTYALSKLPQIINHTVTINVASGTYPDTINLLGFQGMGSLSILGDTVVSANFNIKNVYVYGCSCKVLVKGLRATDATAQAGFKSVNSVYVIFDNCSTIVASSYGFYGTDGGTVLVTQCLVSNQSSIGILSALGNTMFSTTNTGTGNATGLTALSAATIGKNGTQPAGTTAETASQGGIIR